MVNNKWKITVGSYIVFIICAFIWILPIGIAIIKSLQIRFKNHVKLRKIRSWYLIVIMPFTSSNAYNIIGVCFSKRI